MTIDTDAAVRVMRDANPVPDPVSLANAMANSAVFLDVTKEATQMDTYEDTNKKTEEDRSRGGGLRIAVAAFVAVLLVGAAIVLLQATDDDAAVSAAPTKIFDGSSCSYDGATEFDLNSLVTFTFINASDDPGVGFVVWEVPDGTTAAEIYAKGIGAVVGTELPGDTSDYEFFEAKFPPTMLDTEYQVTVPLDRAGLYSVNCFDVVTGPFNTQYATIITVS